MQKNKRKLIIAIYVAIALYLLPMYPHGGSANETTRWATAASIVERGSFDITWTEPLIGPNVDTAKVGNSTVSNKPPGVALLVTPVYAVVRIFVGPPDASNIRISWFLMKVAASTLPLLLLAIWLYRKGAGEYGLAALLFATPLFGYSLLLFSHVLAAVLVYAAFRLLFDDDDGGGKRRRDLLAGAACGFAVITEFPAAVVVAVFGASLFIVSKSASRLAYFAAGGVPFLVFLLIYNSALFGSPFSFSYAHESFPEWAAVASRGILGIGVPTPGNAYLLLLSPARGLFFYAPVLLLTVIDFFRSPDRSSARHRIKIVAVVTVIIVLCGHGAAHGGWGFGPRYLMLVVPLLLDSLLTDPGKPGFWRGGLLTVSIVFCTLPMLTFPFAPPEFDLPQNDFWLALMIGEGWFVPTVANIVGLPATLLSIVPVLLGIASVLILVLISREQRVRFALGMLTGAVACASIVLWPGFDSNEDRFRRATIAERYFLPRERLEEFHREASRTGDWPMLRRISEARWNIADIRAYAPDNFPYSADRHLAPSPTSLMREAIRAQQRGDIRSAERALVDGKALFDFARCEFAGNLAVIYYTSGQKEKALTELQSIQPLVNPGSRPDCIRTQFLLGTLYREMSLEADASNAFRWFMLNSSGTTDPNLLEFRRQVLIPDPR